MYIECSHYLNLFMISYLSRMLFQVMHGSYEPLPVADQLKFNFRIFKSKATAMDLVAEGGV